MVPIIDIADAMVVALNAASLSQSFVAVRKHAHSVERSNLALQVLVLPKSEEAVAVTRGMLQRTLAVDVVVIGEAKTEAVIEGLMLLVEEIKNTLKGVMMASAAWVSHANEPIYIIENLEELDQFTSVVIETYRLIS